MGSKENRLGAGFQQFPVNLEGGLLPAAVAKMGKQLPLLRQNRRRALGEIDENVRQQAFVGKNDAVLQKNVLYPVTRKYAAQIVTVSNPQEQSVNESVKHGAVVDDEVYEDACETQIPMFVRHTEAMLDEIDRMEEIDMEDVQEDQIMDIDSCDAKNELAVVDYVDDIYAFYRKSEESSCVAPTYMDTQFDINDRMRAILIDWLIEVHHKFELMEETLFLTVSLIDRFLERETVARKKLQLVGVTAMLIASKYEEVSVPVVEDFVYISDRAYTRQDILDMERSMLNTLQFNMSVPTPYVFLRRFLKAAQSDKKLEILSFFMVELCLVEYEMLKFQPSKLAAAAVYTAMCTLDISSKNWNKTTEWHSKYTENQLLDCAKMMVTFHQRSAIGKLTGVYRKYSTSKFGFATSCEPAQFLLAK